MMGNVLYKLMNCNDDDSDIGYFLEVNVQYPE